MTAPVFCSIVRAPDAMPRRFAGNGAHHGGGVRAVEDAEPTPSGVQARAHFPSRACRAEGRHAASATAEMSTAQGGEQYVTRDGLRCALRSATATTMPAAIGASLMPAVIGSYPAVPGSRRRRGTQGEAGEAVDERRGRGRREQAVLEDREVEHRLRECSSISTHSGRKIAGTRPPMTRGRSSRQPALREGEGERGEADR